MKADRCSALNLEIVIIISDEELSRLDEGDSLEGTIRVPGIESGYSTKPLMITRGILENKELLGRTLFPENVGLENIQRYYITLSDEAIEILKEKGATGDRLGGDHLTIYTRDGYVSFHHHQP